MKTCIRVFQVTVVSLVAAALLFGAGFFLGRLSREEATEVPATSQPGPDLTLPQEVEKMVVTAEEVEAKIFEIGELTTCEGAYTVTKGKDFTRYMLDIPVPGTTNHVELTCCGIVKAGYELDKISILVDEKSKIIYVSLPQATVHSNQLIWDDSVLVAEENNILNPIDFEQYQTLIAEIKAEGLAEVEKEGLYKLVERNGKNLVENFLGCFVDYTVAFL